jgi:NADPH:quinone reductase-like Zn-dependent oxidoreductase
MTTPTTMMKALELVVNKKPSSASPPFTVVQTTIPKPTPSNHEVLIKVQYTALDTSFNSMAEGGMFAGFLHDMKSRPIIPGYHYVGTIEQVGKEVVVDVVTDDMFKVGAIVFGHLPYSSTTKQGAFSEYITVDAKSCAVKPPSIGLQTAAASATEAMTALQSIRDIGGLKKGQTLLILGGGGGVGAAAIGIAKSLGATVTAVCSTRDVERLSVLGADQVIDRTTTDITKMTNLRNLFDVVFDTTATYSILKGTTWLKPRGTFVTTQPSLVSVFLGWFYQLITGKKIGVVMCASKKEDLELVGKWMTDGTLKIEVDSEYKVSDFDNAWKRHKGPKQGRVVLQVEGGW